ncbi:hypothetical protein [Noviherbaspirillum denitrificans]|uniref:TnsA endonuclease N-terminal domain-containing protein n=1 Tax=Noviherbaspirillum denitrificans TaxID=1968433 RepID=A0A254TDS9_9BURK|nr:hypothetical protein [Noviherbaspirillum denitrificans]OWW20764.1 hypothetical protein AYR66_16075 [Noviherbaspirillum denitrificans]
MNFECWKKAREGKTGISGNWYSLKGSRTQACHSMLEARLRAFFDMSPFVLECRTQYPSWNREEYEKYFLASKPFPNNKVMTIDFMLTLSIPGIPYLLYHGVSGKPREQINHEKSKARHEREADSLSKWGCTHEVLDEFTISDTEYSNYLLLKQWFKWTDVSACMHDAAELAESLLKSKAKGNLDRVLPMVGRRLGHDRDHAYRLFGVAAFLGHIWIDHRFPLRIERPLVVLR